MNQLERVGLQNALNLIAGVHRPGTGGVEFDIRLPVLQSLARLARFFVGERKVVVRVCVGGSKQDRRLVSLDGFLYAPSLVENVAQVEIGERVAGIGMQGCAIMLFREREILAIVVQSA